MKCPRHSDQEMTLLFSSYACDRCDPPKGGVLKIENLSVPGWVREIGWRADYTDMKPNVRAFGEGKGFPPYNLSRIPSAVAYEADIVFRYRPIDREYIYILKHRWEPNDYVRSVSDHVQNALLHLEAMNNFGPNNGANPEMIYVAISRMDR